MPDRFTVSPQRFTVTPETYARVARVALAALTTIVLTGAAVRLSGSGLGCPDWPKCFGRTFAPLQTHAVIEYTNRLLSGLVGIAAVTAGVLAFRRRPFRRDLAVLGVLLPLGVVAQAVLGGFTVRQHLRPGFVMAHFGLSMLILVAAVALAWRAAHEPGSRPRSSDRLAVWGARGLVAVGAVTIFAGTAATAAGPHAGGQTGQTIHRLHFDGRGTLNFTIHQHARLAALLGMAALALGLILRRRDGDAEVRGRLFVVLGLLAAQGAIGAIQYALHLPSEIVWVHVTMAAVTWVAILWTAATAGRLEPHAAARREREPGDALELDTVAR